MAKAITTVNPTTGEQLAEYPLMSDAEVNQAIERCHNAFLDWRLQPIEERAEVLTAIGAKLRERTDDLAEMMMLEMGKPIMAAKGEVQLCAALADYAAKFGPEVLKDEDRQTGKTSRGIVTYSPMGVIYGIQPWNFPGYQVVRYSVDNLIAGNGVMLKHASNVTGCGVLIGEIYEQAGLPKDLFTVLKISHGQSDDIIEHPLVRGVTLTGSDVAGKKVAAKAGEAMKKTVLELGSNDAYLVLEDADLEKAVKHCVRGRVFNTGQTCVSAKRFIIVDKLYDQFRDAYVAMMQKVAYGDPTKEETQMGPMATHKGREDLQRQVDQSVEKGAKILCGGFIPDGDGAFYPATVLENVEPGQPAYDDELFGPVASLVRAKDDDDAMRIANDSRYGLGGGIFSEDIDKATRMASQLFDTGMVAINGIVGVHPNMPFGGVKDSGHGREHGGFGMKEFVNIKGITINN